MISLPTNLSKALFLPPPVLLTPPFFSFRSPFRLLAFSPLACTNPLATRVGPGALKSLKVSPMNQPEAKDSFHTAYELIQISQTCRAGSKLANLILEKFAESMGEAVAYTTDPVTLYTNSTTTYTCPRTGKRYRALQTSPTWG